MSKRILIAGIVALGLGTAGAAQAQSTTTAPATSPPETMNGSSTMNNPATAATPPPGSPAAMSTPGTTAPTAPALGTAPTTPAPAQHSSATGAPMPGANSFTVGEARARLRHNGFTQVSDLKLDDQGIWRGKAMKGGKHVGVALDFKGNVVAQ